MRTLLCFEPIKIVYLIPLVLDLAIILLGRLLLFGWFTSCDDVDLGVTYIEIRKRRESDLRTIFNNGTTATV